MGGKSSGVSIYLLSAKERKGSLRRKEEAERGVTEKRSEQGV